jgi:hypothetical protein
MLLGGVFEENVRALVARHLINNNVYYAISISRNYRGLQEVSVKATVKSIT